MRDYKGKLIGIGLGWFAGGPLGSAIGAALGHLYDTTETPERFSSNPYAVLGLENSASKEDIRRRYMELSAKYHPDKVNHLGEELIRLAREKSVEINRAYEAIRKERGF